MKGIVIFKNEAYPPGQVETVVIKALLQGPDTIDDWVVEMTGTGVVVTEDAVGTTGVVDVKNPIITYLFLVFE